MPKSINRFTKGRMDSDTHYSLIDNESYSYAENLRILGDGADGAFKNIKGSELVSDHSEEGAMRILGMYEGNNDKVYYFLAMPNGKSKIVEYDIENKQSRLIIQDNTVLRFDLVRWELGKEIKPLAYILNINQVGNLLIFSNEKWKNVRCVNISRTADYANGFTEEDIALAKEPPFKEPYISAIYNSSEIQDKDKKDKFISFCYRYKYKDGDYSTLSFFSVPAFKTESVYRFMINAERLNTAMTNSINTVELIVNSGGKNVTDVEVYAKEHGSDAFYLIESINKKNGGHADDISLPPIKYTFSTNYKMLADEDAKALYSNSPFYPKTQDMAGNRVFFANYKEGYDLPVNNPIKIEPKIFSTPVNVATSDNETIASLFAVKVAMAYYDKYNVSTTALLNEKQIENEVFIPFENRLNRNNIKARIGHAAPEWAKKFKFLVNVQQLNYETLYITYIRKIGIKTYLLLNGDNINRVKKGEILIRTDNKATGYKEYTVNEVKEFDSDDGMSIKGVYALIDADSTFVIEENGMPPVNKSYQRKWELLDDVNGSANPQRFDAFSGYRYSYNNYSMIPKRDVGKIFEGDTVTLSINFIYGRDKKGRGEGGIAVLGNVVLEESLYAAANHEGLFEFLKSELRNPYLVPTDTAGEIYIKTNHLFPDLAKEKASGAYHWQVNHNNGRDERFICKVETTLTVTRGVKPMIFRTKNKEVINEVFYETPNTFDVWNGQHMGSDAAGYFDLGYHNAYSWGNGIESYKMKDAFNAKPLLNKFRPTLFDSNGYKRKHRKFDITYSGLYNHDLGLNYLSLFDTTAANWKELPIRYGAIQRIVSTDGNITAFFENKVVNVYYGKSLILDAAGNETLGLSKEVLGDYKVLPYEYGISKNPESVAVAGNAVYFTDRNRSRFLVKAGEEIRELNSPRSGFHKDGVNVLKAHSSFLGCYDDKHGEYIISLDNEKNIGFSMQNQGFTAYYNWKADYNFSMNGKGLTAYKGRVYENEVTNDYGNIAGQEVRDFGLRFYVNIEPNLDKVYQSLYLQSNTPWDTEIRTNLTATKFPRSRYDKGESFYYTNIFRDSGSSFGAVGVGSVRDISGNSLMFSSDISNQIAVGDTLTNESKSTESTITGITGNLITVQDASGFQAGEFTAALKQQADGFSPDGVPIRGDFMEVTLKSSGDKSYYISSVTTEVKPSP